MKFHAVLFSVLLIGISFNAMAQTKIAVFDLKEVLKADRQVQNEQQKIKSQFLPEGQKIFTDKEELQKEIHAFSQMSDKNSNEAQRLKIKNDIQKKQTTLWRTQLDFKRRLREAQKKSLQVTVGRLKEAVTSVAQAKKINLVLTTRNVAYNDQEMDITADIIHVMRKISSKKFSSTGQ